MQETFLLEKNLNDNKMIRHVFFDLDRTLWDFEANSHETLLELCDYYNLKEKGILNYERFINSYKIHNEKLWHLYRLNKISQKDLRRERFQKTLADFGINDFNLSEKIGEDYHLYFSKKILGQVGITKSILRFKGKKVYPKFSDIQLIWLYYQNKRKVKMTFSNLKESMGLDQKRFIFQIPSF